MLQDLDSAVLKPRLSIKHKHTQTHTNTHNTAATTSGTIKAHLGVSSQSKFFRSDTGPLRILAFHKLK